MLKGTYDIVDGFLGTDAEGIRTRQAPFFRYKRVMKNLIKEWHKNQGTCDIAGMLGQWQTVFANTWTESQMSRKGKPSVKNWRLEPQLYIQPENDSPEIVLQRQIARDCGQDGWINHVPTCASYCNTRTDSQVCIDLVNCSPRYNACIFVELKWKSNTPLYAAIEILRYYGLHLFGRAKRLAIDPNSSMKLLDVPIIELWVLAPESYYLDKGNTYCLAFIQDEINRGLAQLTAMKKLQWPGKVSFAFKKFSPGFHFRAKDHELRSALKMVSDVYPNGACNDCKTKL